MPKTARRALLSFLAVLAFAAPVTAAPKPPVDPRLFESLRWREVGPYRGGRCAAVTGVPQQRETYYFGSTGGGVWKTTDGGRSWKNVSDGYFGGSIGAVAVSEWDPNVVYVGGGEKTVRGNVSHGDGVWKSTDAGKSWTPRRARRLAPRAAPPHPPARPRPGLRRRPRPPLRPQRHARRLPQQERRQELGARPLRQRRRRRRRPRPRPGQPARPLRLDLAGAPPPLDARERRLRLRALEVHRRRRHLARAVTQARPAEGDAGDHRRQRLRRRPAERLRHRRGRRGRRLSLARRRRDAGPRPTSRATCGSAPGTTPASTPTPRTPTPSTSSTSSSTSPRTAARPSPPSAPRTATTTTCGSTPATRGG